MAEYEWYEYGGEGSKNDLGEVRGPSHGGISALSDSQLGSNEEFLAGKWYDHI